MLRVNHRVRALNRWAHLLLAPHISAIASALQAGAAPWGGEHPSTGVYPSLILTHVTAGAALSYLFGWVAASNRRAIGVQALTGHPTCRTPAAQAGVNG